MLDIKFLRENPEAVKENIRRKFQESKLELVDQVVDLDQENRKIKQEVEELRANRNKVSKQIGALMGQGKKEEAEKIKQEVAASGKKIEELSVREKEVEAKIKEIGFPASFEQVSKSFRRLRVILSHLWEIPSPLLQNNRTTPAINSFHAIIHPSS